MSDYAIVATDARPDQHLLWQRPAADAARALVIVGGAGTRESRSSTNRASTGGLYAVGIYHPI